MNETETTKVFKWRELLDEREVRLINNCKTYKNDDPAGLPGHNIMLIVAKMADLLDQTQGFFIWHKETMGD
ncbi:MAG: hypothetical protein M9896_15950 [Candidatus Promineofilum sp.]|uniref:hypothetical protein n=1 Tax=Promineifilum sp. TaxID=2664178 RepID=UPI002411B2F3|nr:hypothetical protein [Promineifilum sp.]